MASWRSLYDTTLKGKNLLMNSLIIELQRDALDDNISVANLLRRALVVFRKLKLPAPEKWINLELRGYEQIPKSDLVRFRDKWAELPKCR